MAWINSTNNFGSSFYVVGPVIDRGVNFTSINTAIAQTVSDGFGVGNPTMVIVRESTYTENIALAPGIGVQGIGDQTKLIINGTVIANAALGDGFYINNFKITSAASTALYLTGVGASSIIASNLDLTASTPGQVALLIDASTFWPTLTFGDCSFTADSYAATIGTPHTITFNRCTFNGSSLWAVGVNGGATAHFYTCRFIDPGSGGAEINSTADFYEDRKSVV